MKFTTLLQVAPISYMFVTQLVHNVATKLCVCYTRPYLYSCHKKY